MDLKRFFTDEEITGDSIVLTGAEYYHAVKVTRHKIGYKIIVCNNTNKDYYCTITDINKSELTAKIDDVLINESEPDYNLSLYIGNNKDLDTVVQKAVECGVKNIIPFTSQHCNIDTVNYDRLNKIILESSKQCGRSVLAKLKPLTTFEESIKEAKNGCIVAFYEHERKNKLKSDSLTGKDISIFIGCEGGFSEDEINLLKSNNVMPYTLGNRILRVSTAVVAACISVNNILDD